MSIEALLTRLATALEENNKRLEMFLSFAKDNAGAKAATSTAETAPTKPAPKATPKPSVKAASKATAADIAKIAGEFIREDKAAGKAAVAAICNHLRVERLTAADPAQFDEIVGYLKAFRNGENPFGDEDEDEDEDEDSSI